MLCLGKTGLAGPEGTREASGPSEGPQCAKTGTDDDALHASARPRAGSCSCSSSSINSRQTSEQDGR